MKNARFLNGYRLVYEPQHPSAMKSENWLGYIYEHIKVAESMIGRKLDDNEVVHHLDQDKTNNRHENIIVLSRSQHMKIHEWLKRASIGKPLDEHRVNSGKPLVSCKICDKTLQERQAGYCSAECRGLDKRKVKRPPKEVLEKEIQTIPMLQLGKKYGVSDNAVRKWAKAYNLTW